MKRRAVVVAAMLLAGACGSDSSVESTPTSLAGPDPARLSVQVLETIDHDTGSFTQGLVRLQDGFYESTGRRGESSVQELSADGTATRRVDTDPALFGEGLELVDGRLIQLTFQAGTALVYDAASFELTDRFTYDGEGWGLCLLDDRLAMSNGSASLTFRDPTSFTATDTVAVTLNGSPLSALNELECVDGTVWANVWKQDIIVGIDPTTGVVHTVVDESGLYRSDDPEAVLNGIAYDDSTDSFWITGKYWPSLYEVRFVETAD